MQTPIGFHIQKFHDGACGKYSLQHALLLLGIPITQKDATKATGIPPSVTKFMGTNEERLKRGIRYFNCTPLTYSYLNYEKAKHRIDELLSQGFPVILSVERSGHWAVLAGRKNKNEYFWIDSADLRVIGLWSWKKILNWIDDSTEIYFIGVKPKNRLQLKHSIVSKFSKISKLLKNFGLRNYWGYYLEDLLEFFDCSKSNKKAAFPNEFFSKYGKMIINTVQNAYYYADLKTIQYELNNYKIVAESHQLTISKSSEIKAVASLTANLSLLACGIE